MIVVVGEALVDLVVDRSGGIIASLGGAPFNTARVCGRLGADVAFAGSISSDRFGTMLVTQLIADGVAIDFVQRCEAPTTLAVAEIDDSGAANYRFYVDGTSAPSYESTLGDADPALLFTGGLALELEPMAAVVEGMVLAAPANCAVMVDVNCRAIVVRDRARYIDRVHRVLARADVVKVSDEDLAYLSPGTPALDAARALLTVGPRAVLLTAGGRSVRVITSAAEADVPVPSVDVIDTIGAGDAFSGGFLAWWTLSGGVAEDLGSIDQLVPAVKAAVEVAALVCTRRGADPPSCHELPESWSGRA